VSVRVLCGTSGFSYAPWKGPFYPPDLPNQRMLAFYAGRLPTVEVNNTFYRIPTVKTLAGWREQVGAEFRFALKAPQRITHQKRLVAVEDTVAFFYRTMAELGELLGPVLYQLPPSLKKDLPRLTAFLSLLPAGGRAAFEFRHASWFADDVYEAMRARGAALCIAESEELETPLVSTAGWGYLRLRKADYSGAELREWAERILEQPWSEAFVFFKHEDGARGPQLAQALSALVEARP
jgi:uncharacterized protein YecE (DUF72 family)